MTLAADGKWVFVDKESMISSCWSLISCCRPSESVAFLQENRMAKGGFDVVIWISVEIWWSVATGLPRYHRLNGEESIDSDAVVDRRTMKREASATGNLDMMIGNTCLWESECRGTMGTVYPAILRYKAPLIMTWNVSKDTTTKQRIGSHDY